MVPTNPSVLRMQQVLPTMYDLPSESPEDPGLPDEFHLLQPRLLDETLADKNLFTATDLNLYYDSRHVQWYKRPDWFLVLGVARARQQEDLRWSYLIWQESRAPYLVVELLSPGTEDEDLGQTLREVNQPPTKWQVYEQILRIPYYVVFDRYENHFRLFQQVGSQYQEVTLTEPRYWFTGLQLGLGVWSGSYKETDGLWLRWFDAEGKWVPSDAERAQQESERAEHERVRAELESDRAKQERDRAELERERADNERERADREFARAEQETVRAERLAAKLRELSINPDDL